VYSKQAPLIGLVGYAQAGKDTFGAALEYRRIAFADPLKEMALKLDEKLAFWWRRRAGSGPRSTSPVPGSSSRISVSPAVRRSVLGVVDAAFKKYDPFEATVFTDVRFQSEVDAIRERKGIIVRITREGQGPVNGHVSEQLVANVVPDFDIWARARALHTSTSRLWPCVRCWRTDERLRGAHS